jgi:hypothetical protein
MSSTDQYARNEAERLNVRLAEIERRLDAVTTVLDLPFELFAAKQDGLSASVREAIDAGDMIEAIKRLRAETGMGLAEAKAAIETAR